MCENMAICVKILFSFNICVKYAHCVKIWLFLRCVQFLMDTILNLAFVHFLMKKKGDVHWLRVSRILDKGDVPSITHIPLLIKSKTQCLTVYSPHELPTPVQAGAMQRACDAQGRKLIWTMTVQHIAIGPTAVSLKIEWHKF
jgi:hypothetical protein